MQVFLSTLELFGSPAARSNCVLKTGNLSPWGLGVPKPMGRGVSCAYQRLKVETDQSIPLNLHLDRKVGAVAV